MYFTTSLTSVLRATKYIVPHFVSISFLFIIYLHILVYAFCLLNLLRHVGLSVILNVQINVLLLSVYCLAVFHLTEYFPLKATGLGSLT